MKLILVLVGGFVGLGGVVYVVLRVLAEMWRAYECIELSEAMLDDPMMNERRNDETGN